MAKDASTCTVEQMGAVDLEKVVDTHVEAFEGYMNTMLGRRYLRAFYGWFLNQDDAVCLSARCDGRIAGFVVGAPVGYGESMNRDLIFQAIAAIALHPQVVFHPNFLKALRGRLKILLSRENPPANKDAAPPGRGMSLVGIGVASEARGRGVGGMLIDAFEEHSSSRGFDYMRLSVYAKNAKARGLYEGRGWEMVKSEAGSMTYAKRIE